MTEIARRAYVISDLHLGGRAASGDDRGFQMMTQPGALAEFIRGVAHERARPVELIIAGDFVDFLAEDGPIPGEWSPLIDDPTQAAMSLRRMAGEPARGLGPVFAALRELVDAGHVITLLLGNHDLELSYPAVRRELLAAIGARPGRGVQFIYDNEAYRIGDALIEHGNRYDAFNQVDHDRLRRRRSLQSRGQELTRDDGFAPPIGSRLVAEVMNPIKARYSFVDLLKPETEAVLPLLLTLEPSLRTKLATLLRTLAPVMTHGTRRGQADVPLRLSDASGSAASSWADDPGSDELDTEDPLLRALGNVFGPDGAVAFAADLQRAEDAAGVDPGVSDASAGSGGFASGMFSLLRARSAQPIAARLPALHKALRAFQHADAFRLDRETTVAYHQAAQQLCDRAGVRYVVFGHSHLARDVELGGGRKYLNTGTWANLLRVPEDVLTDHSPDHQALARWVEDLRDNRLDVWFRPTYARLDIDADDRIVEARTLVYAGTDPSAP